MVVSEFSAAMSSREDLLDWSDGVKAFEAGNYRGAIEYFSKVTDSVGARAHFNCGMAYGALNQTKEAIDAFTSAVRADKYFVAGYFMRGYHQIALRGLGKALQDYDNAANFMRGNAVIDYTQLGLACKVYYAEIMFNRGMVQFLMNRQQQAFEDLAMASQCKMDKSHDIIEQTLRTRKFDTPFTIPKTSVYRPPEQKLKNAQKVDYIKKDGAKLVASTDAQDQYTGFKDAHIRKEGQGGPARVSSPPPPPPPAQPASSRSSAASPPPARGSVAAPPPPAAASAAAASSYATRPAPPPPTKKAAPSTSLVSSSPPTSSPRAVARPVPATPTPRPVPAAPAAAKSSPPPGRALASQGSSNNLLSSGAGAKIKVKCYSKDTRIVLIESDIKVKEFLARIKEKFENASFTVKYKDEDGDLVILADQEDLSMAFAVTDLASGKMDVWCE